MERFCDVGKIGRFLFLTSFMFLTSKMAKSSTIREEVEGIWQGVEMVWIRCRCFQQSHKRTEKRERGIRRD